MNKYIKWAIVGILVISVFSFLFGKGDQKETASQTTSIEDIKASKISKEKFDFYYNVYQRLIPLQEEYEETYEKYGYADIYDDVDEEDFPKYGAIIRKITPIRDEIPKLSVKMSDEERDLLMKLSSYATSLIFLTAKEDELEGLDVVLEERSTLETTIDEIKQTHGY